MLIVDDEEHIRRLVRAILTRLARTYDVRVKEAANAAEAIALLETEPFHLIISDHSMPGRTGIDLLAECHRRFPRTGRMLITALEQLDIGVDAVNRGRVDAFLRKPWDNEGFIVLVKSLLADRVKAPPPPATPAAPLSRTKVEAELAEVERVLQTLRVRMGLGNISPEGFARVNAELTAKRAQLEVELLSMG